MTNPVTGTIAAVTAVPLATVLTVDAVLGATTLVVDDAIALDPNGGALRVGGAAGEVLPYSATDPDASTVTVAPTAAAWPVDTPVEVWDAVTNAVGVEYRAIVTPAGTDDEDVIDAVVTHALVPLLPEGLRDAGTGETVVITQVVPDAPWVLTDIVGRMPVLAGAMIAPGSILADALGFTVGDTTATISPTAPGAPQINDIWFDSSAGYVMKQWDGAAWVMYQWNTGSLADGSITADKIAAGSITADLIAAGAIVAGALDAGALNALTIIAGSLDAGSISSGSIGSSNLDGCTITNTDIVIDDNGGTILLYAQSAQTTTTFTTSGTWTCPAGVTTVKVECWAGGGAGGGGGALGGYGSYGGTGGEYAREQILPVVPGVVYPYTVGGGAVATPIKTPNGAWGGDTDFDGRVVAHGGPGAFGSFMIAGGSGSTNTVHYTGGGNSKSGVSFGPGNGGGSSAGTTKAGNPGKSATVSLGGAGGAPVSGGGAGGAGGANTAAGVNGTIPGGGGGGGGGAGGAGRMGGAGARGQVKITYGGVRTLAASMAGFDGIDPYGTSYPAGFQIAPRAGGNANDKDWRYVGAAGQPAFKNSWKNYGAQNLVSFYKDAMGFVHLSGSIYNGALSYTLPMFTLPVGYRPGSNVPIPCMSGGSAGFVNVFVSPAGDVLPYSGTYTGYLYLSAVTFMAEA